MCLRGLQVTQLAGDIIAVAEIPEPDIEISVFAMGKKQNKTMALPKPKEA
jgi:hypothetical protein